MIFYTDGSTHPSNPGPGGFGVVIVKEDGSYETYSKQTSEITTNNREEMKAILYSVCYAIIHGETAEIYSDSAYAINTFSKWMYNWEANGWVKSDGYPPENLDIIKSYMDLTKNISVSFYKVKGHNNNKYNEIADKLAKGEL